MALGGPVVDYHASTQDDLAGTPGLKQRAWNNIEVLRVLDRLEGEGRHATAEEQRVVARWSGWGALPAVFDTDREDFADVRAALGELLDEQEFAAARATTVNAHYTDAAVTAAMWRAASGMGLAGARVLEPGCGSGNFLVTAPEGFERSRMVGVELDPTTARVAAALSPSARIHAEGFEKVTFPDNSFDLTIGNVPFGNYTPFDPTHNPTGEAIHNAFILKSLDLTAPGGVVMVLTSRFTMDSEGERARRLMAERADLLGAVRLPTGAHAGAAGTDAVTDVLVFRTLEQRCVLNEDTVPAWVQTVEHETSAGAQWTGSRYWSEHPEDVLGEVSIGHGMHNAVTVQVTASEGWVEDLDARLSAATAGVQVHVDPDAPMPVQRSGVRTGDPALQEGFVSFDAARGGFFQRVDGEQEPLAVGKAHVGEVRELLTLRDLLLRQLALEAASLEETAETEANRAALNTAYDTYVAAHGPVNRFAVKTNKNGVERREVPVAVQRLRRDPFMAQVTALEVFDETTQQAGKAAIFDRMVVQARRPVEHVDRVEDALTACRDQLGRLDIDRIAGLLGVERDEAAKQVAPLTFTDPATGGLVDRDEYLSGNVLDKVDAAREAAQEDPKWEANLRALEEVVPEPLRPGEITARLGAPWIPDDVVTAFAQEHFDPRAKVVHAGGAEWTVTGGMHGVAAVQQWGTTKVPAGDLMERLLRQKTIRVTKAAPDGKGYIPDVEETEAAQAKADEMHAAFSDWVWSDPQRTERLAALYNRTFNATVPRVWNTEGMTFPGLARNFVPREHQKVAVARMLAQESLGMFHEVGAGKTASMVMGAMELKRLGLVNKPALVVPNNMVGQFQREFLQLYPQARLLVGAQEQVQASNRRRFIAQCATGDWDAVVMSHSAFTAIGVMPATEAAYLDQEASRYRDQVAAYDAAGLKRSVKSVEKMVKTKEKNVQEALNKRVEAGMTFEATGIDYLCVDELHLFKNLPIDSNREGVGSTDYVKKTVDLDMKLMFLRERNGGRVITGATGTPVANSMSELWTMNHYLAPQVLAERGMDQFDAWAAAFGVNEVRLEPRPDGSYQAKERFARFVNVPELMAMQAQYADIKTQAQLNLPRPALAVNSDGRRAPEVVLIKADPEMKAFQEEIRKRLENAGGRFAAAQGKEQVVAVYGAARRGAVDVRMIHPEAYAGQLLPPSTKLAAVAETTAHVWRENKDNEYLIPGEGVVSDKRGALQIVFCDQGVPGGSSPLNVYEEMRSLMAQHGMDPTRIRFVHEATKTREKEALFAACRAGDVDVLIGSTERMGVGTNVQARAVALHHVDCPWKPAEITQREGRILRQGNQHDEVRIIRYATEGSFDGFSWSTIERKAAFVAQVMSGRVSVREMEDIGGDDMAANAAELVAVATGNPLVLESYEVRTELEKLRRAHERHDKDQESVGWTLRRTGIAIERKLLEIEELEQVLPQRQETTAEKFTAAKNRKAWPGETSEEWVPTKERAELARHIHACVKAVEGSTSKPEVRVDRVARMGGFMWDLRVTRGVAGRTHLKLTAQGVPGLEATADFEAVKKGFGVVTRMENLLSRIESRIEELQRSIAEDRAEIDRSQSLVGAPFEGAQREHDLERRNMVINAALEPALVETHWEVTDDPSTPAVATAQTGATLSLRASEAGPDGPMLYLEVKSQGHTFSTRDEQDWPLIAKYVAPHQWPDGVEGPVPFEQRVPHAVLGVVAASETGQEEPPSTHDVAAEQTQGRLLHDDVPQATAGGANANQPAAADAQPVRLGALLAATRTRPAAAAVDGRVGDLEWVVDASHERSLARATLPDGTGKVRVFVNRADPASKVMIAFVDEGQEKRLPVAARPGEVARRLGLSTWPESATAKDLGGLPNPEGLRAAWRDRQAGAEQRATAGSTTLQRIKDLRRDTAKLNRDPGSPRQERSDSRRDDVRREVPRSSGPRLG